MMTANLLVSLPMEESLASQHEAAVNDAQQIWPPLIATCGHLSWA